MPRGLLCGADGGGRAFQWNEAVSALCITAGGFGGLQHRNELIGCTEVSASKRRGCHGHERFKFFGGIGAQIDLGTLEACMTEPQRHFPNIVCGQQSALGARMAAMSLET